MNDKDRIRLAGAMFPEHAFAQSRFGDWLMCHDDDWGDDSRIRNVPDPFTDANDDYAVLEWMRKKYSNLRVTMENHHIYNGFCRELRQKDTNAYRIGDYARAALKVLDDG